MLLKIDQPILHLPELNPIDIEVENAFAGFQTKSNFTIKIEKIDIITFKI